MQVLAQRLVGFGEFYAATLLSTAHLYWLNEVTIKCSGLHWNTICTLRSFSHVILNPTALTEVQGGQGCNGGAMRKTRWKKRTTADQLIFWLGLKKRNSISEQGPSVEDTMGYANQFFLLHSPLTIQPVPHYIKRNVMQSHKACTSSTAHCWLNPM